MKARWISIPATALMIIIAGRILADEALVISQLRVTDHDSLRREISISPKAWGLVPVTQEVQALAKKSGCLECHSVDKKVIGPAFHDIAVRYKDDARARNALIEKVKKGGKGNWTDVTGGVPMPPHSPRISDTDIKRLVDWVLGL